MIDRAHPLPVARQAHAVFPYRIRELSIDRSNQVWGMVITYIPMKKGFLSFAAVMDWCSRRSLSYRLSNTMTADFWVKALEDDEVYLRASESISDARRHLDQYLTFYSGRRPHMSLADQTPDSVYFKDVGIAA